MTDMLVLIAAMAATGAFAGLVAGLFGIGGGVVMVPAMYYALSALGYQDDKLMHVAVGTSLAVIVATSMRSLSAHAKRGGGFPGFAQLGAVDCRRDAAWLCDR